MSVVLGEEEDREGEEDVDIFFGDDSFGFVDLFVICECAYEGKAVTVVGFDEFNVLLLKGNFF